MNWSQFDLTLSTGITPLEGWKNDAEQAFPWMLHARWHNIADRMRSSRRR